MTADSNGLCQAKKRCKINKENVLHGVQALESRLLDGISKEQQEQWLAITKKMIQNL